jgi:excisionase family DNA binding protein
MSSTPADDANDWVSLSEAAKLLGVHPATVRAWADEGHLQSQRTPGGHRRFRLADLRQWLAKTQPVTNNAEAELMVQSAMGKTRLGIGDSSFAAQVWYQKLDRDARESMSLYGRQLMEVLQRYLVAPTESGLGEAYELGNKYGTTLRQHGLSLLQATEGFFAFQDFLLSAALQMMETGRSSGDKGEVIRKLSAFTRAIILALVACYEPPTNAR